MNRMPLPSREQGAALLLFMLLLVVGVAVLFLPETQRRSRENEERVTAEALGKARAALLGYAAAYADVNGGTRGPGFLPCPDLDNDGYSDPPCNTPGQLAIGRLPWRQLESGDLRDGDGERLWYAVSSNYREAPKVGALHSDTDLHPFFTLNGAGVELGAVVLAPGKVLPGQSRPSNRPGDYLEGINASMAHSSPRAFRSYADESGNANDRALGISREELSGRMERRVLAEGRRLLKGYAQACGYLPWAAPFDPTAPPHEAVPGLAEGLLPVDDAAAGSPSATVDWNSPCAFGVTPPVPAWFTAEGWQRLVYYAAAAPWLEGGSGACGACLILNGTGGVPALLVAAGRDLVGVRPSPVLAHYFEGDNATAGDGSFESRLPSTSFNDKVKIVDLP
ncbi:MAG TPA: hypothetical protein ENJ98_06485 [Thiolapillus brandeum]|uniref:Type II secretion system protein n=1 Tax=Thiolapillus brandeum TaxID=1076588 RepID=A0A7C5J142_9GAMM|nr:hypothetical protein [Thiolapillus brandeum]